MQFINDGKKVFSAMIRTVGYVSEANPFTDRRAWSGLRYKIREAIENSGVKVIWIPYQPNAVLVFLLHVFCALFYGRYFGFKRHPWYLRLCAKSIEKKRIEQCDILFFPGMAQIMPFVKTNVPYIYYVDATFCVLGPYYGGKMHPATKKYGDLYEQLAIEGCTYMLHASRWSAEIAESYYHCDPNKNLVFQFGANIDSKDIVKADVYSGGPLNILFSGVEWKRKGAEQAIEAVGVLRERGYDANLYLCGIREIPMDKQPLPNYVVNCGFLNKNIPEQYQKYIEIIKKSHLFLLPTSAECAGVVFSESSAYGLPIFTYNTGGIGDYVKDGVNGYKLPLGSTGTDFANAIEKSIKSGELEKLAKGGLRLFKEELSWEAWSDRFRNLMIGMNG